MLLDKISLSASKVTENENSPNYRPALGYLKVDSEKTTATNGHMLIQIPHPVADPNEFPTVNGYKNKEINGTPVLIHAESAKTISKNIKKAKNMPILENAMICEGQDDLPVVTTDLDQKQVVMVMVKADPEINFPDTDKVWPKKEPTVEIGLGLENLKKLVEILKASGSIGVKLSIIDNASPFVLESLGDRDRVITGLIMPMRIKD